MRLAVVLLPCHVLWWAQGVGPFRNIDNSELRVGVMGLGEASYLVLASIGPSCSVSRWALKLGRPARLLAWLPGVPL